LTAIPPAVYSSQDFLGGAVLTQEGRVLSTVGLPVSFALSEPPEWTVGPRDSSMATVDAGGGQMVLLVAQPVADSGNLAAVVASADQLQAWIAPVVSTGGAHVMVVERSGGVLIEIGARPRLIVATEADAAAPLAYFRNGGQTPAALAYTPGGEALAGIAAVAETSWGVISERSTTAALALGRSGRDLSFLVLMVVLGLAAVVGLVTAQALTHPLERLATAIRHVARGGRGVALPRSSIREIASLSADFEEMQRELARREAQERAARAEADAARHAAEEALRLRDVFLRTLAHDLKAPLASLAWHVQVLQLRARDGHLDPTLLDEGLQAVSQSAGEAVAAIDELHDLTRLAAGAPVPLQREPVDLVALARRSVNAYPEPVAQRLDVQESEASLVVDADPARVARVLHNLLDNAIKYSGRDSHVMISVGREELDGAAWATLRVRDEGMGIPPTDLPHVFDLYHRGANVASTGGEGLGLASARQLVELHGGRVGVQSEEGVGSVFTVWLPLASAVAPQPIRLRD
jgi:signal transduction histidine kinase